MAKRSRIGGILLPAAVALLGAIALAPASDRAGDEPPLTISERRCHRLNPDGTLTPGDGGPICFAIPRLVPWSGSVPSAGVSLLRDGQRRYEAYKRVLGEVLAQPENPATSAFLEGASRLLAGVTRETTAAEAASLLISRASALGKRRSAALISAAETVVASEKEHPLGGALQNGGLRAVILEALHTGFVLERGDVFRTLVRVTAIGADPFLSRALEATISDVRRRHQVRLQILRPLFRAAASPEADLAAAAPLPVLPRALAREAFPGMDERGIERLGYGASALVRDRLDPIEIAEAEADLIVLATLEDALFSGAPFVYGCDEGGGREHDRFASLDRDARTAGEIRLYIAREFNRRLDDRLGLAGERDVIARLDESLVTCGRPVF